MFRFEWFTPDMEQEWDRFIDERSINGTFLQTRKFLNYHPPGRFIDASIIVYNEKNNICSLIPACKVIDECNNIEFCSHKGSTFGGIVIDKKHYCAKYVTVLIKELKEFLKNSGFNQVTLKLISNIFSTANMELFQYVLCKEGFKEYKELSTYVDFSYYKDDIISNFAQGKRTNVHNCLKADLECRELMNVQDIEEFYSILCENLQKHNTKPVHTLDELIELKYNRLDKEIGFYGVYQGDIMLAGSMMFYFDKAMTAHTQYLAAKQDYNKLSPMTFMYYSMIAIMRDKGYKCVSWGTATEDRGSILNMGLITSKEDFGSAYINNLIYSINL